MNLLIPLPIVALMLATFGLLCYAIGASHISNWLMGDHQRLDAAVRLLYHSTGFLYPDDESEPRKPWWRRLSDRMEPTVDAQAVEEASGDEEQNAPDEANEQVDVEEQPDEPERDWRTDTGPITMPEPTGPATVPSAAVIDADWEARSQQMLAEARAAIAEIGGGR